MLAHKSRERAFLKSKPTSSQTRSILFVALVAVGGATLLLATFAATGSNAISLLVNSGKISGNASLVANSTAIGGQAVKFGSGSSTPTPTPTPTTTPAPTPTGNSGPCGMINGAHPTQYAHVIWIWMENHPYNEIIGNSQAPYINSLGNECALSHQAAYDSPFAPSAPNYIAATSGRDESANNSPGAGDCAPTSCPDGDVSIFEQATSWKTYSEGEPTNCDPGFDGNAYDVNHNPAVYYTRISAACKNDAVPLGTLSSGALVSDLNNNTLPQFSLIDPNLNDDMHDGTIAQGDTYLSQLIPLITSSAAYKAGNTAVFLTWDEDEGGVGIPFIAINPYIAPGLKFNGTFTHFSLLRTTEEMLGLPLLQNAASSNSMRSTLNL
jgi:hypothetical protein